MSGQHSFPGMALGKHWLAWLVPPVMTTPQLNRPAIVRGTLYALLGVLVGGALGMTIGSMVGGALGSPEGEGFIGFILGMRIGAVAGLIAGIVVFLSRRRVTA